MDEDWHAICQAIYKDVEGQDRVEMHTAIDPQDVGRQQENKGLVVVERCQGRKKACYDRGSEQHIQNRSAMRQALGEAQTKSPTAANGRSSEVCQVISKGVEGSD